MKHLPLFLLALSFAVPAFAQEQGATSTPVPEAASEEVVSPERLALAQKMHEIWPIRTRVESAIDAVAKGFPPDKQAQVKASIRKSIQYDELEEGSIRAMASTYNEDELKAMIEFYGSDVGRSISAKTADYELALRPIMVKMMDKAMLDLKTGLAR